MSEIDSSLPTPLSSSAAVSGGMFRALRHRNYRLFLSGQFISVIGTWMQQTAMGWLIYQLTNSQFLLGLVAAVGSAPLLLFSMWGGSLADRHSKRAILVATQSAQMIFAFALAGLAWFGQVQPWHILVLAALNGTAFAFDMPARQSFLIEMTSREDLLNAISLNSSGFHGGRFIGPALAGIVMARFGAAVCFFLNGASFLAVIAGLLLMRVPKRPPITHHTSPLAHALGGLHYVLNHPRLLTILALFGVVGIFGWSYAVLMPVFARDVLGLSAGGYGALMSASGLGAFAGAMTVAALGERIPARTISLTGVWWFSAMLLLFSITRNFHLAMVLLAGAGFGSLLFFSTANSTVQLIVPDEMRGRVMGVWALVFGATVPLGGLEAGFFASRIGAPKTAALGAIVSALAAVVALLVARRREAAQLSAQAHG